MVTDPAAIALHTDVRGVRMVAPFLHRAMTLTEAARGPRAVPPVPSPTGSHGWCAAA